MKNFGVIISLIGAGILQPEDFIKKAEPVKKKYCLECGAERQHNNSFCSAKCHKDFYTSIRSNIKEES